MNYKASANSRIRTFAQRERAIQRAQAVSTSLTLMGKAEIKSVERVRHGYRSVAPWTIPVGNVGAWLQTFKRLITCDVNNLSVGQMRRFNIRKVLVGLDGIRRVLFSEPQPDGRGKLMKSVGLRQNRIVEVVFSFA